MWETSLCSLNRLRIMGPWRDTILSEPCVEGCTWPQYHHLPGESFSSNMMHDTRLQHCMGPYHTRLKAAGWCDWSGPSDVDIATANKPRTANKVRRQQSPHLTASQNKLISFPNIKGKTRNNGLSQPKRQHCPWKCYSARGRPL